MPNMPKRERSERGKYEGKDFLTYEEAMDYLGVRRSSLYNYLMTLDIQTRKFKLDRKRYVAMSDIQRIEQIKRNPWLAEEQSPKPEEAA